MKQDTVQRTPQELVRGYIAAYNAFDLEGMAALLSMDVRFENHSNGVLTAEADGLEAFCRLAEQSKALFSAREQRPVSWTIGADTVAIDIDYFGTLAQDVPGGPAAGSVLALKGSSEFSFAGGKITRIVDRS